MKQDIDAWEGVGVVSGAALMTLLALVFFLRYDLLHHIKYVLKLSIV